MQLVVVIAVKNAVSAATKTFAPISMILFFIIQRFNTIIFLMLLQVIPFPLLIGGVRGGLIALLSSSEQLQILWLIRPPLAPPTQGEN